jgi:sulfate permease, SulP family
VTVTVVLLALGTLTSTFYYIPTAALAAIVMVAVLNLIDPSEFWHAWKLSKKDFWVMLVTFVLTLVFDTEIGLGAGLGLSLLVLLQVHISAHFISLLFCG